MFRLFVSLCLLALLVWSCDPSDTATCSGSHPDFRIVLKLASAPLPADTTVHVTYAGSAEETFRLAEPNARHDVTFCQIADENGAPLDASAPASGAAGAAGADSLEPANFVATLYCELWTSGYAQIKVSGSGFDTVKYELAPKEGLCTVDEPPFVLDSPDAG